MFRIRKWRESTVTIHPGAHKTASTLIQRALRAEFEDTRSGISLISRKECRELPILRDMQLRDTELLADAVARPTTATLNEIHSTMRKVGIDPDKPILISDEGLFGSYRLDLLPHLYPFTGQHLDILTDIFGDRIRVVFYIRNPIEYFVASYIQTIQSGHLVHWDEYRQHFTPEKLSWLKPITEIVKRVGAKNTLIIPFDAIKTSTLSYCDTMLAFTGFSLSQESLPKKTINPSLSDKAMQVALAAYPHLERSERRDLRKHLQRSLSGKSYTKFDPFTDEEIHDFLRRSEDDILHLAELCPPELRHHVIGWTMSNHNT